MIYASNSRLVGTLLDGEIIHTFFVPITHICLKFGTVLYDSNSRLVHPKQVTQNQKILSHILYTNNAHLFEIWYIW